jgi:hypothetical protein
MNPTLSLFGFLSKSIHLLTPFQLQEKSATDEWMDELIKSSGNHEIEFAAQDSNPYAELEQYLEKPPVSRHHFPDVIAFWGVSDSPVALLKWGSLICSLRNTILLFV